MRRPSLTTRRALIIGTPVALLLVAFVVWPVYPSRLSVCELIATRGYESRFASPHRGALMVLEGSLLGGPEGMYLLRQRCRGHETYVTLSVSKLVLATPASRQALGTLENENWRAEDRVAPVRVIARVQSNVVSCFGPGLVFDAIALRVDGPVQRITRAAPPPLPEPPPRATAF